jgi:hypothetical protein
MAEPARKLEPEDHRPPRRPNAGLRLVAPATEHDQAERWVLESIMACYCTPRCED